MHRLFFLILFLTAFNFSFAHMVWRYENTKNGITLIATGSLGDTIEVQRMYDAFLDRLSKKLKRPDKKLKILLLLDQPGFANPNYSDWIATIAFDTLRETDTDCIEGYYFPKTTGSQDITLQEVSSYKPMPVLLREPIDLNLSFDKTKTEVGLKIRYDYGETDSVSFFDRIYTLTQYGIDHINNIKTEQRRMVMDYYDQNYGITVSFLSIDTSKIKEIPLLALGFDKNNIQLKHSSNQKYIWITAIIVLILFSAFYLKKKRLL
jgi:hypothetical protein